MVIARSLRGMNDLFEEELAKFNRIEEALNKIFHVYGYQEIKTPILEEFSLFKRGIGETTDIVEKEMFIVEDNDHTYCLRPENTAPVVRALIERGGLSADSQEKLFYFGPMFRKERPQKGRLRQFHQFGIESFGVKEPDADIEILVMVDQFLQALKLPGIKLLLNSLGTNDERKNYKEVLSKFLRNCEGDLCEDCLRRMAQNTLRVLDCKKDKCKAVVANAPSPLDSLGKESLVHFEEVQKGLSNLGVDFIIDNRLVRGLDYYNRTVFEFVAESGLGAQNAVVAGGRYDGLFQTLGNKFDIPSIGCAGGVERIAMLMDEKHAENLSKPTISLIGADDSGLAKAKELGFALRRRLIATDFSMIKKSVKAQMRKADKIGAKFILVIGENEINNGRATIKSLATDFAVDVDCSAEAIYKCLVEQLK